MRLNRAFRDGFLFFTIGTCSISVGSCEVRLRFLDSGSSRANMSIEREEGRGGGQEEVVLEVRRETSADREVAS